VGSTLGEEGSEGRVVVDEVGSCSQELGEGGRRQARAEGGKRGRGQELGQSKGSGREMR
jgi:hypothetical protein